jgi:hypothetical protein
MESIPIPSSSESSNDDSDDDIGVLPEKEKDPENVGFNFLRTGIAKQIDFLCFKLDNLLGKSSKEGVLITHGGHFKFTKNNYSRDGKTHWYTCSNKQSHGCTAPAPACGKTLIKVSLKEGIEDDSLPTGWKLNSAFITNQLMFTK